MYQLTTLPVKSLTSRVLNWMLKVRRPLCGIGPRSRDSGPPICTAEESNVALVEPKRLKLTSPAEPVPVFLMAISIVSEERYSCEPFSGSGVYCGSLVVMEGTKWTPLVGTVTVTVGAVL